MKTRFALALILLTAFCGLSQINPDAQSAPAQKVEKLEDYLHLEKRVQEVAAKVRPAVVGVRMSRSSGSGCFISEDGWVATAGHVTGTQPGTKCRIVMHGGEMLDAIVHGWHENMDYGLIKADTKGAKVPFCELGDSEKVSVGQWLIPMGHPLGPEAGRDAVVRAGRVLLPENARSMIVIDAPVISGDSGGPVFDLGGKIVAINQSIQTNNVHINNVTPVALYKELLGKFKKDESFGNAAAPSWGKGMREPPEGALSPAEVKTYRQAIQALQARKLKRCAELFDELLKAEKRDAGVLYNGACAYSLRSEELEGDEAEEMAAKAVATLRRSTDAGWTDMEHAAKDPDLDALRDRDDFNEWVVYGRKAGGRPVVGFTIRSSRGVRVDDVRPNSPAARLGIQVDDLIERVGREKIKKGDDWADMICERGIDPNDDVRIKRSGQKIELKLTLPPFGARVFGQGGARLIEVFEGGLAFNAGLKEDDVIIRVGETEIGNALEFANAIINIDSTEETILEVKRGYSREMIKFSYNTGDLGGEDGGSDGTLPRDDWKQGLNLLTYWGEPLVEKTAGAIFVVKQKGKQVAFATAVDAGGLLVTKASEIDVKQKIELLDGDGSFEVKLIARNDRYDLALLKADRKFKHVIDFSKGTTTGEFPKIGTMLASVDAKGDAITHGFVALEAYDSDKIVGAPDPNSPYMGISAKDAEGGGAEVLTVSPGMPAADGGIQVGDVVKKLDGQEVADWTGLIAMIRGRSPDDKVVFEVLRDDETVEVEVQLKPRAEALGQQAPSKGTGKPELGIFGCVRAEDRGLEIGYVKPGSPAELAGINSGEILLQVGGKDVASQREIDDIVKAQKIGDSLELVLLRDGEETILNVELAEEDAPPPPPGNGRPNVKGPINSRYTHLGKVIQHDGVVLPSQQGAPVFDLRGNLIGLNIARADRTRTFALSAAKVATILAEMQYKGD